MEEAEPRLTVHRAIDKTDLYGAKTAGSLDSSIACKAVGLPLPNLGTWLHQQRPSRHAKALRLALKNVSLLFLLCV